MIATVGMLGGLALLFGLLLGYATVRFKVEGDPVVEQIDAILPQQQCGKCGYPGCRAYAKAIVKGEADINQCVPGGSLDILTLANLLDRTPKSLDIKYGVEGLQKLAVIDESTCIGCLWCIQVCPVDAILGAPKQMHTVIAQECMGCERCIAHCPVNSLSMISIPLTADTWKWPYPVLP
ncbi:MAG: electron transport complex subunit RsxB [Gammaproteobacteria bacterium]|nr:MAG: electron transport complex subunit RsxB [Gammaproteobacteria bacterium]RKZ44258.1 MAG: electron transport complex subunit RsxB [Gammaproteobacteria bacterium]RKZ75339.1 MAG: electron transport complex subunit RsxB [Gammaproteobacteria bacterium]